MLRPILLAAFYLSQPLPAAAMTTMQGKLTVTEIANGFEEPWAIGHSPAP